ncbi:unnamed protein product [Rotaria magnacalcarata]|uniref:Uncharacterized protein n=1 Tax=Rotaria magnacalcarata TaxID=392030 RepID=A0A816F3Y1_9BILA|nr:unnamed protein product [Rotaria magnacalcarata]
MAQAINKGNQSSQRKPPASLSRTMSIPATSENFLLRLDNRQISTVENSILIWLDTYLDIVSEEFNYFIARFQELVHLILPFFDVNRCIDFILETKNEKIFLVVSGSLGETLVPIIHDYEQIDSIYIYCENKNKHEKWANEIKKIKGVFQALEPMFDVFRRDIRQCEDDLVPFHILSSNYHRNWKNNPADQLFIYTQLLKDILIEMDYKSNTKKEFTDFCRCQYLNNSYQLNLITEFRTDSKPSSSIYWYTRECFLYLMLSKALRIQDINMMIQMGFFIRDIHREIIQSHSKLGKQNSTTVYRGQGITEKNFHQILENNNGFLSFNNFLIATTDRDLSIMYASFARDNHELTGVLFVIEIDQSKSLFTPLDKISYYPESEQQILFSIQNVFRIRSIDQIENGLWQIQLKLTTHDNELVRHFRELVQQEIPNKNENEWLNTVKMKIQQLNKARGLWA